MIEPGTLFSIINHTSSLSVTIPLICCAIRFRSFNSDLKILFVYIAMSALTEVLGFLLINNNIHTYLTFHLFTLLETSFLTFIYFSKFATTIARLSIAATYSIFLILAVIILVLKGGYNKQDNILSTYEAAFFIVLSGAYFYKLMGDLEIQRLKEFYFSWINTAVLTYFSMAFFLFLFNGYIENRGLKTYNNLYTLHWIVNIAYNILLSIGIWKIKHK